MEYDGLVRSQSLAVMEKGTMMNIIGIVPIRNRVGYHHTTIKAAECRIISKLGMLKCIRTSDR